MTYVVNLAADQHFAYSAALLRSLHFMMTEYALDAWPGRWRPGPIWVRNDVTGEAVYSAPEAEEVPALMEVLVTSLHGDTGSPPIVAAAMAHLNLVMIHPFRDGLLRAHGRNRGAFYEAADPLRQVGVTARRARLPIDTSTLFAPTLHDQQRATTH